MYAIMRLVKDKTFFRKILPAILWLIFCIVAAFFVSPSFRFALLAPIPAILLITEMGGKKIQILLTCIILILAFGYTVYNTNGPFTYFANPVVWNQDFLNMIPSSMQQNTLPLEDTSIVESLFHDLSNNIKADNNSLVFTPGPMLSHALLSGIPKEKILWTELAVINSSSIKEQVNNGNVVYIVWWKIGYQWYGIDIEKVLKNLDYSIMETKNSYAIYYIHGVKF